MLVQATDTPAGQKHHAQLLSTPSLIECKTQVSGLLQVWAEQMAEGQRGGAGCSMVWGLMGAYGWCNIIQIKCVCVRVCVRACVSSVQFSRSVVSNSMRPHELQHTRPPCPSPTPRVHSNSCPLSR